MGYQLLLFDMPSPWSVERRAVRFEEIPPGRLFWSADGEQWQRNGGTRVDFAMRLSDYKEQTFVGLLVFVNDYIEKGFYRKRFR